MSDIYGPGQGLKATTSGYGYWYATLHIQYTITRETESEIVYRVKYGLDFNPINASNTRYRTLSYHIYTTDPDMDYYATEYFETNKQISEFSSTYWIRTSTYTYTKKQYQQTVRKNLHIGSLSITFRRTSDDGEVTYKYQETETDARNLLFTLNVPALNQYTVTFNANGHGTAPATQYIYYGRHVSRPTDPSATGWTFGGWYTDQACTNAFDFSTVITGNRILYAKWTVNTYTITYYDNGGTGTTHASTQSKVYNAAATLHSTTQDGFTKLDTINGAIRQWLIKSTGGWNTNANGSGTAYNPGSQLAANTISSNLYLYAQWQATYIYPTITNLTAIRTATASSDMEDDDGEYLRISFNWTGYSNNNGSSYSTPTCQITIDGVTKTVTLTGSSPSSCVYRPTDPSLYSSDVNHTITVKLYDPNITSHSVTASLTVPTAILPIDLYGSGLNVYMGIMHPYVSGQVITIPNLYIDTTESTGIDAEIRTALTNLGWTDVLS